MSGAGELTVWVDTNLAQVGVVREYSIVFNGMAVQLNGVAPDTVRGAPGVVDVTADWLYRPSMDVSVPLINAPAVWSALGVDLSGTPDYGDLAHTKVGVVDTGILDTHPFIASCRAASWILSSAPMECPGTARPRATFRPPGRISRTPATAWREAKSVA